MSSLPITESETTVPPKQPKKNWRGRGRSHGGSGSRNKRDEEFRSQKNVEFDEQRRSKIAAKFGAPLKVDLPSDLASKVKMRAHAMEQPLVLVPIVTYLLPQIIYSCLSYIGSSRVSYDQDDVNALLYVTSLQISTKIHFALQKCHFSLSDIGLHPTYISVAHSCTDAFAPVAKFIDSIGSFSIDGGSYCAVQAYDETNHPELKLSMINNLDVTHKVRRLYSYVMSQSSFDVLHVLGNLDDGLYQQLWQVLYPHKGSIPLSICIPSVTDAGIYVKPEFNNGQLVSKFKEFMNRVVKKFPRGIIGLDLMCGSGALYQLVGSKEIDETTLYAYASTRMETGDMALGALFGYGRIFPTIMPSPIHDELICPYRTTISSAGWAQDLARALAPT